MSGGYRILIGDVLEGLRTLETGSVQACITSPPYWDPFTSTGTVATSDVAGVGS